MLLQLSNDVWMDVLDLLREYRKEMAQKFSQFGDRQFSEIYQHWLHEATRNVGLYELRINSWTRGFPRDKAFVEVLRLEDDPDHDQYPLADVPMPDNISTFQVVEISYFDSEVFSFLRKMKSLFTNIHLDILYDKHEDNGMTLAALGHLFPHLNGIEAITFADCVYTYTSSRSIDTDEKLVKYELGKLEIVELLLRWLWTKSEGAPAATDEKKTRIFAIKDWTTDLLMLVGIIRGFFLAATSPAPVNSFIMIHTRQWQDIKKVPEWTIHNGVTGEQLILRKEKQHDFLCICCMLKRGLKR